MNLGRRLADEGKVAVGTPEQYAHILAQFPDADLEEVMRVAKEFDDLDSTRWSGDSKINQHRYKECQFHCNVDLKKNVDRLVVHPSHKVDGVEASAIRNLCKRHGWEFVWADEEEERR